MTVDEMIDAMDGLFACDSGCVDSGVHDVLLKRRLRDALLRRNQDGHSHPSSDEALRSYAMTLLERDGGGIEDVASFIDWLRDEMKVDV